MPYTVPKGYSRDETLRQMRDALKVRQIRLREAKNELLDAQYGLLNCEHALEDVEDAIEQFERDNPIE